MSDEEKRVEVCPVKEKDISQIETIERESFSVPWSFDSFRNTIQREDTLYLAAWMDGQIVGYCGMYISFDEGEIPNVAVHPGFRCRGIGHRMLTVLLEQASERGVDSVFLEVRESNRAARALYGKLGFKEVGIRKNFYEKPREHAVVMCKNDAAHKN